MISFFIRIYFLIAKINIFFDINKFYDRGQTPVMFFSFPSQKKDHIFLELSEKVYNFAEEFTLRIDSPKKNVRKDSVWRV